jgi:hypothetical protein
MSDTVFKQMMSWMTKFTLVVEIGLPTLTSAGTRISHTAMTQKQNRGLAVGTISEITQPASASAQSGQCQTSLVSPSNASEQPLRRSRYWTAAGRDGPFNSIKSISSKQFFCQTSKTRSLICAPGSLCMSIGVTHHKLHTFNNSFLAAAR